jgi:hypothetical protein
MATLTRLETPQEVSDTPLHCLDTSIPKPFPSRAERQKLLQDELLEELANESVEFDTTINSEPAPSWLAGPSQKPHDTSYDVLVSGLSTSLSHRELMLY